MSSIAQFISENPYLSMLEKQSSTMSDLRQIHGNLTKTGLINHPIAATRVLSFSASFDPNYALAVFSNIPNPNLFAWNTLIRAFSNSSDPQKAIFLFIHMLNRSPIEPQRLTYPSVFKACARLGHGRFGSQLHCRVVKLGLLSRDSYVRNSVLHMYVSSDNLKEALQVFDESPERDVVAWNAVIAGLSRAGEFEEARKMFDKMPERSLISWSTVISGCVKNGRFSEAFEIFGEMQARGIAPNAFVMVSLLNASAQLGAIEQGEWIHKYIEKHGLQKNNPVVSTAIVDMYGKCGCVEKALRAFETALKKPGKACWNAMISGLATNGRERDAIELFSKLESPDDVSFLAVLTACRHAGLVEEAREHLRRMKEEHGIEPSVRHYGIVVDVLGRAGLLEDSERMILAMPMEPDAVIWGSLLSACERHGNVEMAERVVKRLVGLDPGERESSAANVIMSNLYAGSGRFEEAVDLRVKMREERVEKERGCSLIEVDGEVHEFLAFGRTHPRAQEIYSLLGH